MNLHQTNRFQICFWPCEGKIINQIELNRFFMDNLYRCGTDIKMDLFLCIFAVNWFHHEQYKTYQGCYSTTKIVVPSNHFPDDRHAAITTKFPNDYYLAICVHKNRTQPHRFLSEVIIFHVGSCSQNFYFLRYIPCY